MKNFIIDVTNGCDGEFNATVVDAVGTKWDADGVFENGKFKKLFIFNALWEGTPGDEQDGGWVAAQFDDENKDKYSDYVLGNKKSFFFKPTTWTVPPISPEALAVATALMHHFGVVCCRKYPA